MPLEIPTGFAVLAAVMVGLSKGGLPAIGMLAVPILAMQMSPIKAAALLLPIYLLTDPVAIWLYRRDFSKPNLQVLIPAGLLGVLFGWSTASFLSDRAIGFLVGAMGIGFCLNVWFGRKPVVGGRAPSKLKGLFWGSLSGFTSFVTHSGSPPFQIYVLPQQLPKVVFAGTSTLLFATINLAKIIPYQQLRPYSIADLQAAVWLVPFALFGTVAGAYLTKRIADVWFFRVVRMALFLVSCKLVWDAVMRSH